jgi:hypothetical protein
VNPALDHELRLLGWRTLATQVLNLRPNEAGVLVALMRRPGVVVSADHIATLPVQPHRPDTMTGSHEGVLRRVSRLRAKLADLGCDEVVTIRPGGNDPISGFMLTRAGAERIQAALAEAAALAPTQLTESAA